MSIFKKLFGRSSRHVGPEPIPYFQVPVPKSPRYLCSDNSCPCPGTERLVPGKTGFLCITDEIVESHSDALTDKEFIKKMRARLNIKADAHGVRAMANLQGIGIPLFMCEDGARQRGLDLRVAAADAEYVSMTGWCPLRPTPKALPPECSAKYTSGGIPWNSLDEETKATARLLRENIESNLSQLLDKVLAACPEVQSQAEQLRRFYDKHSPEIIANAVDCSLVKNTHQLQYLYPSKSLAFVVTLINNTIEGAKRMLIEVSRDEKCGYSDLVARLTDVIPKAICGMYHLILLMSRSQNHFSIHLCMINLSGRDQRPIAMGIWPNSLLTDFEKSELGL